MSAVRGDTSGRAVGTLEMVLDLVLALALGWVLWVTAEAEAAQGAAASGSGRPGVMVIDGLRPARGADIPIGTFTERDGTVTSGVAWQDRPANVGDRKEGVRVGVRAWGPEVQVGLWDVLLLAAVAARFAWRVLVVIRHWRRRRPTGP